MLLFEKTELERGKRWGREMEAGRRREEGGKFAKFANSDIR